MMRARVIPVLQLREGGGLVKTRRFKDPVYVGDPINAVKIFNDKGADELILVDIDASKKQRGPDFALIEDIVAESFMPIAYGGGITSCEQAMRLFRLGVEKVIIGTAAFRTPELIHEISQKAGAQAVVVSIDVASSLLGKKTVEVLSGSVPTKMHPVEYAKRMVELGAGELMVTSIARESAMDGYDIELMGSIAQAVDVPVIAHGGAGTLAHLREVVDAAHVSAMAAGSMFVFQGKHRAVLIHYPLDEIDRLLSA